MNHRQDAELEPPCSPVYLFIKLRSQCSLLNLFRKDIDLSNTGLSTAERWYNHSSSASTPLASPSPIPVTMLLPTPPWLGQTHLSLVPPPEWPPLRNRHHPCMASDTHLGDSAPSAADLHNSLSKHAWTQSRSGNGHRMDWEATADGNEQNTIFYRPTILCSHYIHTPSSSNPSQWIQGALFRALPF